MTGRADQLFDAFDDDRGAPLRAALPMRPSSATWVKRSGRFSVIDAVVPSWRGRGASGSGPARSVGSPDKAAS